MPLRPIMTSRVVRRTPTTSPSSTRTFGCSRNKLRIGVAMSAGDSQQVAT